jgi:hypothetical protein
VIRHEGGEMVKTGQREIDGDVKRSLQLRLERRFLPRGDPRNRTMLVRLGLPVTAALLAPVAVGGPAFAAAPSAPTATEVGTTASVPPSPAARSSPASSPFRVAAKFEEEGSACTPASVPKTR